MNELQDLDLRLTYMTHDARRILRSLKREHIATIFDQITLMTWCYNYSPNKVFSILSPRFDETNDLRKSILSVNELNELSRGRKNKKRLRVVKQVENQNFVGQVSSETASEISRKVSQGARQEARAAAPKAKKIVVDFELAVFNDRVAQRLFDLDQRAVACDYTVPLHHLFDLLVHIHDDEEFREFVESFDRKYFMPTIMNRLEYYGTELVGEEAYTVFKPEGPRMHASESAKSKFDEFVERFKKITGT